VSRTRNVLRREAQHAEEASVVIAMRVTRPPAVASSDLRLGL
jgi:hypothetical protein